MGDGGLDGERLTEVSRLAGVLADQVLRESMVGAASMTKLTALGKAALLLQDYDRPVPDLVIDVLGRALRGAADGRDGTEPDSGHEAAFAERESEPEGHAAPRRLFPRLIQTLRPLRG